MDDVSPSATIARMEALVRVSRMFDRPMKLELAIAMPITTAASNPAVPKL